MSLEYSEMLSWWPKKSEEHTVHGIEISKLSQIVHRIEISKLKLKLETVLKISGILN